MYSTNSISELSDNQIQTVIDYFSKNPDTGLYGDQDSIIDTSNLENFLQLTIKIIHLR